MRTSNTVASLIALSLLGGVGCSQTKPAGNPGFEQKAEHFEGIAQNSPSGPSLQLDDGRRIGCIVDTEGDGIGWPDAAEGKRLRVDGYRIRSDSADPNGIVIRCVNWTPATAPSTPGPESKN